MAQGAISEKINRHVEAVLALSKREILWELVREAELCVEFDQTSAAAILAGIALEKLVSGSYSNMAQQGEQTVQAWRQLRNRAAHPASLASDVDPAAVAAMVMGIRGMLDQIEESQDGPQSSPSADNPLTRIRGKYAFVPTSVEDFLKRKREDVNFENHR
jgi:hypothetical protein